MTFFFGYIDTRPWASCALCNKLYPISTPWQRFCSPMCNDKWQCRYGQKGRTRRLKRQLNPELGTFPQSDLNTMMVNGQLRIRGAVNLGLG